MPDRHGERPPASTEAKERREGDIPSAAATRTRQRDTRQRRAVVRALDEASGFLSAQALHAAVRQSGERVGLATVYRALQALSEAGEVDVLRDDGGEQLYRRCDARSHHHHLVCRRCGLTVEVASPTVERWASDVAAAHGFVDVGHDVEVFGLCRRCSAQPDRQQG